MGLRFDKAKSSPFPDVETYFMKYSPNYQYDRILSK